MRSRAADGQLSGTQSNRILSCDMTPRVLMLTGTCGSGKTTIAALLAKSGWSHISEDALWLQFFGNNRGSFGSTDHRSKRQRVHEQAFAAISSALEGGHQVVLDATLHESPPEAFLEYVDWFDGHQISWALRVLHPNVDVAIARDAARPTWHVGADRVRVLHDKFNGSIFPKPCFIDTSNDTPEETLARVLRLGA